jgi:hypothetical protein
VQLFIEFCAKSFTYEQPGVDCRDVEYSKMVRVWEYYNEFQVTIQTEFQPDQIH